MSARPITSDDVPIVDAVDSYLRQALSEEGVSLDSIDVTMWETNGMTTELAIVAEKYIGGELRQLGYTMVIDSHEDIDDTIRQQVATAAREIRSELSTEMIDTIRVAGTRLRFCASDGGWVECDRCGERLYLEQVQNDTWTAMKEAAEISNPSPSPYNIRNFLRRLKAHQREILKLYLLGALRNHCTCSYGKYP